MLLADGSRRRSRTRPRCRGPATSATGSATACSTGSRPPQRSSESLVVFAIIWRVADGAWPAIKVFHLNFLWDNVVERAARRVRRARSDHRHARDLVRCDSPGRSALDCDRTFPERARTAVDQDAGRNARRHARGSAERRDRAVGHLRARTVQRAARSAVHQQRPRAGSRSSRTVRTRSSRRCSAR